MLTKEQRDKLLKEVGQVLTSPSFIKEEYNLLNYISQICRVDYNTEPIEFYSVKDRQGIKHIRCWIWYNDITILDHTIERYRMDTPDDYIIIVENMLDSLWE